MKSKNFEIRETLAPEWLQLIAELSAIQDAAGVIPRYHDWRCRSYQETPDPLAGSHLEFWRNWEYGYLFFNLEIQDGMAIADVGCGNSPFLAWLKQRHHCEVWGIETLCPSQNENDMPYMAGRACHPKYREVFGVKYLDVENGVFNEPAVAALGQFDRVVSIGVLEHIPVLEAAQFVRQLKRLCKPEGLLGITYDVRTPDDIPRVEELVQVAGLTVMNPDFTHPGDDMPFCITIRGLILHP